MDNWEINKQMFDSIETQWRDTARANPGKYIHKFYPTGFHDVIEFVVSSEPQDELYGSCIIFNKGEVDCE